MNALYKIPVLIFFFILSITSFAQTRIFGVVKNSKREAVPFANVYIKDSYDGASTDETGKYSFTTTEQGEQVLVVSFVGYTDYNLTLTIKGKEIEVNPIMAPDGTELEPVIISAGAFEASDTKKSVVLSPLDIVTTAGANGDIYGALQTLPGTQQVGEQEGLFVRGGTAGETGTIIDEMFVQDPFFSSVPDVPQRGRFSPFLFKGTIFSTGGYSALYGQALSSVLVLNTQDLSTENRTGFGILPIGGNISQTLSWKKSSLSLAGSYSNLIPYFKVIKQLTDWNKPPKWYNGYVILRQKTSETGMFKFYSTYSQNKLSLFSPNLDNPNIKNDFSLANKNIYVNSSWREILNANWSVFIGSSFARNNDDINQDTIPIKQQDDLMQEKVIFTRNLKGNSMLKFGTEVHQRVVDGTYDTLKNTLNENYVAGFIESDIFITNKLAIRVGVRGENSDLLNAFNLAPRTALAYKTSENSQISMAYGQFFQTPENQYLFQITSLGFQKATHYIANYQIMKNKRTFRIEFYEKTYDNLIKYTSDPIIFMDNSGTGYAQGVDVFFRDKKTIKNSDYWLSYSYLDTKRNYLDYPKSVMPYFASKHTFSLVYKYWIAKISTSLSLTYTYGSGRPYYDPNLPLTEYNSSFTPDYHNINLSTSYLTQLWGNFTIVFASVGNLLGTKNIYGYRYNSAGEPTEIGPTNLRTFFIGMFVSIDNKGKKKDKTE